MARKGKQQRLHADHVGLPRLDEEWDEWPADLSRSIVRHTFDHEWDWDGNENAFYMLERWQDRRFTVH